MALPLHSVILPVHNGEKTLEEALKSILRQSCASLEVIAINDHSSDSCLEILEAWKDRLPLQILTPDTGGNWMAATNLGLQNASGTWIHFLHQDDRWEESRLEKLEEASIRYPDIPFFCHQTVFLSPNGKKSGRWTMSWPPNRPVQSSDILPRYATQNILGIPSVMFRKTLFNKIGPLREDLWFLADWDFWLRAIHASGQIVYLDQPLAGFRIHSHSQTTTRSKDEKDLRQQFAHIRNRITVLCGEHPDAAAAKVNEDLTITLANWHHQKKGVPGKFILGFLRLGPVRSWHFLRDSRILERVVPRIRIRLGID